MAKQPQSQYLSLLTAIFALTAFILMWVGSIRCNFIKFTDTSGTSEPISKEFGIWYYQFWTIIFTTDGNYFTAKTCNSYPDSMSLDASWKAARAFCALGFIFAIIILIVQCVVACSSDPEKASGGARVAPLYLMTGICQGLTLLFLSSEACKNNVLVELGTDVVFPDTCSIATGAKCCISATVFWVAAALSSFQEQNARQAERSAVLPVSLTQPPALTEPLTSSSLYCADGLGLE